ncbi:MAG: ACP S-malonyltransferase [Xenococcaceae cyanobacterium MO_188.B32]|nr:ACP S-malonyltransferase [Xenococcaceae cyanobacterium MO_188.B32]
MKNLQVQTDKNITAWVFPGQGSQKLGMGIDLLRYPFARSRLEKAQEILGWSVLEVCQNWQKLNLTLYTQPCLYVIQTLLVDILKQTEQPSPNLVAGYSLGEYSAMYAAGVFDFETGLKLIKRRAEIMHRAPKGTMVALIGFNKEQLEQQVRFTANVWRVNDNSRMAVIAGTFVGVKSLLNKLTVKRIIPLDVSGAFHTPLMAEATAEFWPILDSTPFNYAKIPFLSSTKLVPIVEPASLKENLIEQMIQSVRWESLTRILAKEDFKQVVEIGTGNNLTSQMKQICPQLVFTNFSTISDQHSLANTLS